MSDSGKQIQDPAEDAVLPSSIGATWSRKKRLVVNPGSGKLPGGTTAEDALMHASIRTGMTVSHQEVETTENPNLQKTRPFLERRSRCRAM
jgi:hypothetical protein